MATDINEQVRRRLRELRMERRLTFKGLSKITGVSQSMLSAIEKGKRSPTLTILNKINGGLRISLSELLDEEKGNTQELYLQENMKQIPFKKNCLLTMMMEYNDRARIEVMRQEIQPHTRWDSVAVADSQVWEYCFPILGTLTMEINGERTVVRAGDGFAFLSDKPHAYVNETDENLVVILINSYP